MLTERRRTVLLVACLVLAGAGIAAARLMLRGPARPANEGTLWRLRYDVAIQADKPGARVRTALPDNTHSCRISREEFFREGPSMDVVHNPRTHGRSAVVLVAKAADRARFRAEFDVQVDPARRLAPPSKEALTEADRQHYLRPEDRVQVDGPEVRKALTELTTDPATPAKVLERIYVHCCTAIEGDESAGSSDAAAALKEATATRLGRARAMVALCRAAGIPARLVVGVVLQGQGEARPIVWTEVHAASRWAPYDPTEGFARYLPPHYLPIRRDGVEIARASDAARVQTSLTVTPVLPEAGGPVAVTAGGPFSDILDLTRLPLGMRHTLAILLLLPLGALVTSIFRNVIGLQTFGTFTPALLALSFLYSDLWTGLVVFVVVMIVGLGTRAMLERLKLLMVPRLSVMLTIVVLCLAVGVSVMDYFLLTPSARAVILPLVIMTMMIERFYICREEDGLANSLRLLSGTLIVGGCCLILLRWDSLGRLALSFPEFELFVAAVLLLLGRYSGYRLSELLRFKDLTRPAPGGG